MRSPRRLASPVAPAAGSPSERRRVPPRARSAGAPRSLGAAVVASAWSRAQDARSARDAPRAVAVAHVGRDRATARPWPARGPRPAFGDRPAPRLGSPRARPRAGHGRSAVAGRRVTSPRRQPPRVEPGPAAPARTPPTRSSGDAGRDRRPVGPAGRRGCTSSTSSRARDDLEAGSSRACADRAQPSGAPEPVSSRAAERRARRRARSRSRAPRPDVAARTSSEYQRLRGSRGRASTSWTQAVAQVRRLQRAPVAVDSGGRARPVGRELAAIALDQRIQRRARRVPPSRRIARAAPAATAAPRPALEVVAAFQREHRRARAPRRRARARHDGGRARRSRCAVSAMPASGSSPYGVEAGRDQHQLGSKARPIGSTISR